MIVLTLARGNNTSFDLRGELAATGVLETDFNAPDTGVDGVPSVIISCTCLASSENTIYISNIHVKMTGKNLSHKYKFSIIAKYSMRLAG